MTGRSAQGTGKHPHKESQEPWPHNERSGSEHESESGNEGSGETRHASSGSERNSDPGELKEREYRDEQGNIHHHTRTSEAMKGKKSKAA